MVVTLQPIGKHVRQPFPADEGGLNTVPYVAQITVVSGLESVHQSAKQLRTVHAGPPRAPVFGGLTPPRLPLQAQRPKPRNYVQAWPRRRKKR